MSFWTALKKLEGFRTFSLSMAVFGNEERESFFYLVGVVW
jgi:hypothetical protein